MPKQTDLTVLGLDVLELPIAQRPVICAFCVYSRSRAQAILTVYASADLQTFYAPRISGQNYTLDRISGKNHISATKQAARKLLLTRAAAILEAAHEQKEQKELVYYVIDLQNTETTQTLSEAREIANKRIAEQRKLYANADDRTLVKLLRNCEARGARCLENGDIVIMQAPAGFDGKKALSVGEEIERFDGIAPIFAALNE